MRLNWNVVLDNKRTLHLLSVSGGAFLVLAMSKGSVVDGTSFAAAASSSNSVSRPTRAPASMSGWFLPDNEAGNKPFVEDDEPRDAAMALNLSRRFATKDQCAATACKHLCWGPTHLPKTSAKKKKKKNPQSTTLAKLSRTTKELMSLFFINLFMAIFVVVFSKNLVCSREQLYKFCRFFRRIIRRRESLPVNALDVPLQLLRG